MIPPRYVAVSFSGCALMPLDGRTTKHGVQRDPSRCNVLAYVVSIGGQATRACRQPQREAPSTVRASSHHHGMETVHALTDIDPVARTATCARCGPVKIKSKGPTPAGTQRWGCRTAIRQYPRRNKAERRRRRLQKLRKDHCESPTCTATIEHSAQLDLHHINGIHSDDRPENLRTLCANCHRLLHALERQEALASSSPGPPVLLG